jgi:hypothetical protein
MSLSIVERLREVEDHADVGCAEAADTIEELVEALRPLAVVADREEKSYTIELTNGHYVCVTLGVCRKARALLTKLNGAS